MQVWSSLLLQRSDVLVGADDLHAIRQAQADRGALGLSHRRGDQCGEQGAIRSGGERHDLREIAVVQHKGIAIGIDFVDQAAAGSAGQ